MSTNTKTPSTKTPNTKNPTTTFNFEKRASDTDIQFVGTPKPGQKVVGNFAVGSVVTLKSGDVSILATIQPSSTPESFFGTVWGFKNVPGNGNNWNGTNPGDTIKFQPQNVFRCDYTKNVA